MTLAATLRRHWVTVTAFFLVLLGTLAVVPRGDEEADATKRVPTLVVTKSLDDGSSAAVVRTAVEVRDLDPEARASGALSSLDAGNSGNSGSSNAGGNSGSAGNSGNSNAGGNRSGRP